MKKILDGIDPKVETAFETGRGRGARQVRGVRRAPRCRRTRRTGTAAGSAGCAGPKDKLLGMPDKVNEFYEAGRELYLKEMDGVISRVADIVGGDLTAAKQRIAKGRAEISAYVKTLSPDLQKVGTEAAKDIGDKFDAARVRRQRQAERGRGDAGVEVRRSAQGARRADRGPAGREQGPGRQGDRRHQGGHQHHPRARRDAEERAGPRGRRRSATSSATRSASSAT